MLFVNDMFMWASSKSNKPLFLENVGTFFTANNIRTNQNMSYVGTSGLTNKYEFSIPGIKNIPSKLIKTMNSVNNTMYAKSILTDVELTKPLLVELADFYVFLNDNSQDANLLSAGPNIVNLFTENGIKTIPYSHRNDYIKELQR